MTLLAFACPRIRVAMSRLLMALSPRQKRLSAATPSSALQARKKPSNTRGVSSTTPTWERGRFTSFTRWENKRGPQDRLVTRGQPAWAGMIGSALFVTVFVLEDFLRPNFNWLGTAVSEHALGPCGWIQIANFIVVGFLYLAFARGVAEEIRE